MTKFLNQRLNFSANSWYIFPGDIPFIAPVIARQALYWRDSSFSWKEEL